MLTPCCTAQINPPPAELTTVTLTITLEVAETLLLISKHIGGSPVSSRRAHTDGVGKALEAAGVREPNSDIERGGIHFADQDAL